MTSHALSVALTLLVAVPTTPPVTVERVAPPRLVYSVQAHQDVPLRSGERVRPRIAVECDETATPRLTFHLPTLTTRASRTPVPLQGRLVVFEAAEKSLVERRSENVTWEPEGRPWTYSIPESSSWAREIEGAIGLAFIPDTTGTLVGRVDFNFGSMPTWHDAKERCAHPAPPAAPSSRSGTFEEYIYVEEFPQVLYKVSPCPYPADARARGLEGTVTVQVHVAVDGLVDEWRVVKSTPGLDEAAAECARQYRFKPALSKGIPVAVWVALPIRFTRD